MKKKKNITTIIQKVSDNFIGPLIPKKIKDKIKPEQNDKSDENSSKKENRTD